MGTLRSVKNSSIRKHMWVMSISDDLSKISFYDPFLKKQIIEIEGKINNRSLLQWYLLATKMNFQAIKYKLEKMETNFSFKEKQKEIQKNNKKLEKIRRSETINGDKETIKIPEIRIDDELIISKNKNKKFYFILFNFNRRI